MTNAHFTSLEKPSKAKAEQDYILEKFLKVCPSIANDVKFIDENIKDMKGCIDEGKQLYITCVNSVKHVQDVDKGIKEDEDNLEKIAVIFGKSKQNVIELDKVVSKTFDKISVLQRERDRVIQRFSILQSLLTPKLKIMQELELLETSKKSYEVFRPTDLQIAEIAAYALCEEIQVADNLKKSWDTDFASLETNFSNVLSSMVLAGQFCYVYNTFWILAFATDVKGGVI